MQEPVVLPAAKTSSPLAQGVRESEIFALDALLFDELARVRDRNVFDPSEFDQSYLDYVPD
jgi:hypothetical protein